VFNVCAPKFIKHTLLDLKAQLDPNTVVVGEFNTPLPPTDRGHQDKKIDKETLELNETIDQMNLKNVCRVFHPTMAQYTFFSAALPTSSKIDHILGNKAILTNIRKLK
jgi:exonuclease III